MKALSGWMMGLAAAASLVAALPVEAHADQAVAVHCLARTVYFEARGDGARGMEAVAAVVMNRVHSSEFPDTVCAVVEQGGETPPCQFSYWCDGRSDRPRNADLWAIPRRVPERAVTGTLRDPVDGALYYHTKGNTEVFPRGSARRNRSLARRRSQ